MKNKEEKKDIVPPDGICKYCGGSIWRLDYDLWKCGHCLKIYTLKGSGDKDV